MHADNERHACARGQSVPAGSEPISICRCAARDRGVGRGRVSHQPLWTAGPCREHALPDPLQLLLKHGWVGVQIFFVISGFVIALQLAQSPGHAALSSASLPCGGRCGSTRRIGPRLLLVLGSPRCCPQSFAEPASDDPLTAGNWPRTWAICKTFSDTKIFRSASGRCASRCSST